MQAVEFYRSKIGNDEGYKIDEIIASKDHRLEADHSYIQWLFPLTEPSNFNPDAPLLDAEQIQLFKSDPALREKMLEAFYRMLKFWGFAVAYNGKLVKLRKNSSWVFSGDHNYLRITRVLKCLTILGFAEEASLFYNALLDLAKYCNGEISENNLQYWKEAMVS